MSERLSVALAEGYLLHARPYRDSSVIAEFFIADHGRVAVVARGVRSPKSRLRGLLQPFQSLLVSWVSRGSLGTLAGLENSSAQRINLGQNLLSAYYVNELVLRALKPGDCHQEVFSLYQSCLSELASSHETAAVLRRFEKDLLEFLGYGLQLSTDTGGMPVRADASYYFDIQEGAREVVDTRNAYSGATLIALANGIYLDPRELREAKRLLRGAIDFHLGGASSRVRKVMSSMSHRRRGWNAAPEDTG